MLKCPYVSFTVLADGTEFNILSFESHRAPNYNSTLALAPLFQSHSFFSHPVRLIIARTYLFIYLFFIIVVSLSTRSYLSRKHFFPSTPPSPQP